MSKKIDICQKKFDVCQILIDIINKHILKLILKTFYKYFFFDGYQKLKQIYVLLVSLQWFSESFSERFQNVKLRFAYLGTCLPYDDMVFCPDTSHYIFTKKLEMQNVTSECHLECRHSGVKPDKIWTFWRRPVFCTSWRPVFSFVKFLF